MRKGGGGARGGRGRGEDGAGDGGRAREGSSLTLPSPCLQGRKGLEQDASESAWGRGVTDPDSAPMHLSGGH